MKIKIFLMLLMGGVLTASAQKTVLDVALGSKDHTRLVTAVKAADLVATLQSTGPFTVFAPTNEAFGKLPKGTLKNLLKPENKATLSKILTYHVVAGNLDLASVLKAIKDGNGSVKLTAVSGGILTASFNKGRVILTDEKGGTATVVDTYLKAGNGVVHAINKVVMPK